MHPIPPGLKSEFEAYLTAQGIRKPQHASCSKRLRFYPGFCRKCHFSERNADSLPHFLKKPHERKQASARQPETSHAVSRFIMTFRSIMTSFTPEALKWMVCTVKRALVGMPATMSRRVVPPYVLLRILPHWIQRAGRERKTF